MAISMIDNISYQGRKPDNVRAQFNTISEMAAYRDDYLPEIYDTFCLEDGNKYRYKRSNEVDAITGKWRILNDDGISELPTASETEKGAVKIGEGLEMDGESIKVSIPTDENFTTELKNKLEDIDMSKKVDIEEGKGLSTNDLTDELKEQYDAAQKNVQADFNQTDDTQDDYIKNKPTALSEFENDSNFITKDTKELENYYSTEDTYSQTEVNALINAINSFKVHVVDELPTELIDERGMYYVPKPGTEGTVYNIYVYSEGEWRNIGSSVISGGGSGSLEADLKANVTCGAINSGTTIPAGTTFEELFRKLLIKYNNPTVTLKLSVSTLRAKWSPVASVTLTATATKGTSDIENITLKAGATEIKTLTESGTFDYTPDTEISTDITFTAIVKDVQGKTGTATQNIKFVLPYYYGATLSLIDPTTLTEDLSERGNKTYKFNSDEKYLYICFDSSYPDLVSILDSLGNENIQEFSKQPNITVTKNGSNYTYKVYKSVDIQTVDAFSLTFK